MDILQKIEEEQLTKLAKKIPDFRAGDTIRAHTRIVEGERERIQIFEGVCIAKRNAGINSSFTIRRISYGEGVERVFPLYSPRLDKIEVTRHGKVRRAKLYYLRGRTGKSARIAERSRAKTTKATAKQASEKQNVTEDHKTDSSKRESST
ncbi:MAG: 50S ribosomal protein L19 [Pseudomonadota bacterium]